MWKKKRCRSLLEHRVHTPPCLQRSKLPISIALDFSQGIEILQLLLALATFLSSSNKDFENVAKAKFGLYLFFPSVETDGNNNFKNQIQTCKTVENVLSNRMKV